MVFGGDGTLSLRTAEEWFRGFKVGENSTMDKPVGGRPVTTNTHQIIEYIELHRHVTSPWIWEWVTKQF
ncbi:Histone-lysine N-methyltransferase SETMAR [Caligus rogercresseyi]|uniref:Histone-lysine N-methyltransferase SETMAR n=1 Tax=Caligus rogercresseyi TaxID=217165 RepID=A0A7T8GLA6_CALRO|nr:Histone-lysine N-methyltransferase SETMAR [Caligus rogercresseyi]